MPVFFNVCREYYLTVSEAKAGIILMRPDEYGEVRLDLNAAGQINLQTSKRV